MPFEAFQERCLYRLQLLALLLRLLVAMLLQPLNLASSLLPETAGSPPEGRLERHRQSVASASRWAFNLWLEPFEGRHAKLLIRYLPNTKSHLKALKVPFGPAPASTRAAPVDFGALAPGILPAFQHFTWITRALKCLKWL